MHGGKDSVYLRVLQPPQLPTNCRCRCLSDNKTVYGVNDDIRLQCEIETFSSGE